MWTVSDGLVILYCQELVDFKIILIQVIFLKRVLFDAKYILYILIVTRLFYLKL